MNENKNPNISRRNLLLYGGAIGVGAAAAGLANKLGLGEATAPQATRTPTEVPTGTATAANTATATETNTPTNVPTETSTATPTDQPPTATNTPENTATAENTATNTPEPTDTPQPTNTPEPTNTPQPTATETEVPQFPKVVFDGNPNSEAGRKIGDGGFKSDCNFVSCEGDQRIVQGPYLRERDHLGQNFTDDTTYEVEIEGEGHVNIGVTDGGLFRDTPRATNGFYAESRNLSDGPSKFRVYWEGLKVGGYGFEIVVQQQPGQNRDGLVRRVKLTAIGKGKLLN